MKIKNDSPSIIRHDIIEDGVETEYLLAGGEVRDVSPRAATELIKVDTRFRLADPLEV